MQPRRRAAAGASTPQLVRRRGHARRRFAIAEGRWAMTSQERRVQRPAPRVTMSMESPRCEPGTDVPPGIACPGFVNDTAAATETSARLNQLPQAGECRGSCHASVDTQPASAGARAYRDQRTKAHLSPTHDRAGCRTPGPAFRHRSSRCRADHRRVHESHSAFHLPAAHGPHRPGHEPDRPSAGHRPHDVHVPAAHDQRAQCLRRTRTGDAGAAPADAPTARNPCSCRNTSRCCCGPGAWSC